MAVKTSRLAVLVWLPLALLSGCARLSLPYAVSRVQARPAPAHELKVAVVPFADARSRADGPDDAEGFVYRGVDFAHTDLSDVSGSIESAITHAVASHLAQSRVFRQVILVDRASDAPEADLILSARIRRARGYVEANERKKTSPLPLDERTVLAEVLIADLELRESKAARRLLLRSDFGWSIQEERKAVPEPPDPWSVLSEALFETNDQLVRALAAADLSGTYVVRDSVALEPVRSSTTAAFGELATHAPPGWTFEPAEAALPIGWRGTGQCAAAQLTDRQTQRFHRALGPYKPRVRLWACTGRTALSYDAKADFPARYLGRSARGVHYFSLALGQSNWPSAESQIARHVGAVAPDRRHVFEIESD